MANQSREKPFAALAREAVRRLSEFNAQGLANTAWAFATVSHRDEKMLTVFARAVEWRVGEVNLQGVEMTLWALSWFETFRDAWHLVDDAKHLASLDLWFAALFMECEERGWQKVSEDGPVRHKAVSITGWSVSFPGHASGPGFSFSGPPKGVPGGSTVAASRALGF